MKLVKSLEVHLFQVLINHLKVVELQRLEWEDSLKDFKEPTSLEQSWAEVKRSWPI